MSADRKKKPLFGSDPKEDGSSVSGALRQSRTILHEYAFAEQLST